MSSGIFTGKESSNRIELSRLVQKLIEFWCFRLPVALGVGEWVDGGGGGWGVPPHTYTCTCMHAHAHMVNMIISCKWLPPLGEYLGIPYDVICTSVHVCMCACVACACMCMWVGAPSHHPIQAGDPQNQSKFNSTWTNRDISILFEDLKSVETPPPMGGCIIWWVGGWVGGLIGGIRSNH